MKGKYNSINRKRLNNKNLLENINVLMLNKENIKELNKNI